jgi:hypothetical protein
MLSARGCFIFKQMPEMAAAVFADRFNTVHTETVVIG